MHKFINPRVETMTQYVLFLILIVMTPFVVVTRYLQNMAHIASHSKFTIFGFEIPYVLAAAAIAIIGLFAWQVKNLNLHKFLALAFIAAYLTISHNTMDIYLSMSFFDLQQNWHYAAYGAYTFFFFRAFHARKMPKNKLIFYSFFSAVGASIFDETFQLFMSQRVFDISDIAKDASGIFCGLIIILFVTETYGTINLKKASFPKKKLTEYFKDPLSALIMVGILAFSFVLMSPLLSGHDYFLYCTLAGFGMFFAIMLIIHLFQYKISRIVIIAVFSLTFILLALSFALNHDKNITYNSHGLTIYKGIPLPYFDVLIHQNGMFHFVDKKHHFTPQDQKYLKLQKPDILLIGSGSTGNGGKGFDIGVGSQFIYNHNTLKSMQVIILSTPDACTKFNELKKENKSVLFVIHNSC